MKLYLVVICVLTGLFASSVFAQTFKSGSQQVPLVELYTSEGCSSCPPADRWMTRLLSEQGLWRDFVPIAFHVDYWDYIGWPDRFASKEYSQRQRRYAAEYNESTVYTPGMRLAGDLWRNWRSMQSPKLSESEDVGELVLNVEGNAFTANFNSTQVSDQTSQINIAILGLDLSTEVKRGENKGKTLLHNFVVLGKSTIGSSISNEWKGVIPKPSIEAPRYAVAAWVTQGPSLTPVQAVGGLLNK